MNRLPAIAALCAAAAILSGCGSKGDLCLPKGEKAIVLRTGDAEGYRFVTLKRSNGEEVTCTGKNTPLTLQPGDEIDGWTMTRADATKRP